MPTISLDDLLARSADAILPPDPEFKDDYERMCESGRTHAAGSRVAFVAICRNAMPFLPFTIDRVRKTGAMFADWKCFIYENDSTDGTKEFIAGVNDVRISVRSVDNGRPHLNCSKSSDRTIALAEYRNACRDWCRKNASDFDYAIVFDTDPWGGWSVDGVANTIGHLSTPEHASTAGMGSYSWCEWGPPVWPRPVCVQYDAWACRWNWWDERHDMIWFHTWHPPVGSPPVKMNSCFGQLGVYRMENYLAGEYRGGDCEHVHHWRTCGGACYLNPSQRVVSFWIANGEDEAGGLREDLHKDVAGRDSDPDHC